MKQFTTIVIAGLALVFFTIGLAVASDSKHQGGHQQPMDHPTGEHPKENREHPTSQSMDHPSHGQKVKDKDHSAHGNDMGGMDHSSHQGNSIRTSDVDGYELSYGLIDMREKMKEMKAAGHQHEMTMTHHLMIYVKSPEGQTIDSAKVGYLVVGPNKEKQKLMCMGMAGGYGADVDFTTPGMYTIKTKVVVGEKKLIDSFSHTMK